MIIFQGILLYSLLYNEGINYIKTRTSHKQWTTELIWLQITKAASGVFECRYQDQQFRDVVIEAYQMNVQGKSHLKSIFSK